MIESKGTIIEESTDLHSDILYAVLLAINLNTASNNININKGEKPSENTIQAFSTSLQVPNILSISAALTLCIRNLLVSNIIDFNVQFDAMWNSHPLLQEQLTKETCKNFFIHALDIEGIVNKIQLDS